MKTYLALLIFSKKWWKCFWSGSAGDLLSNILSIVILIISREGKNTNKIIWSKSIKLLFNKLINSSENKIESKLTPEFPIKILLSKFGSKTINKEIAIAR